MPRIRNTYTLPAGNPLTVGTTIAAPQLVTNFTDIATALTDSAATNAVNTFTAAQRGGVTALTSTASSLAIDLAASNHFSHVTTENTVLAAPTNPIPGQSGVITITQGATPRTLTFNTFWKFAGGTVPTLTATAGAVDAFAYYVNTTGFATCTLLKDIAAVSSVIPGSQVFSTAGTFQFTVPTYNTLTIDLWGGGGAGGAAGPGSTVGGAGESSTIVSLGMTAGGGGAGIPLDSNVYYRVRSSPGGGGTATGGNTLNASGGAGIQAATDIGGDAANGGTGGAGAAVFSNSGITLGSPGNAPGGGGGGGHYDLGGNWLYPGAGGGGANCRSVFAPASLAPGTLLTVVVGAGGQASANNAPGDGATGQITFTWG